MHPGFYKLAADMKTPVPCTMEEWSAWRRDADNSRVALTLLDGERIRVSTVFLGLDHSHCGASPVLFETMIFGLDGDEYQTRCSTWEEALKMHEDAVVYAKQRL